MGDASSRSNQIAPASVRPDGEVQHEGSKRRRTETPQSNLRPFPSELVDVFRGDGTSLVDNKDNFTASVKLGLENLIREDKLNGLSHDLDQYHARKYPFGPTYPFVVDEVIKELQEMVD